MTKRELESQRRGESTYHTQAVSRALKILSCFSVKEFELSVADLHRKLGIHKSTLVRLLQCLAEEGFIEQNPTSGNYRLGIKTFEIGSLCHRTRIRNIGPVARPYMERLVARFNVSANLAIRVGTEIVYVETVEPVGPPLRMAYSVGDRFGVHHTSLGKALIAFLPPEELEEVLDEIVLTPLTPRTVSTVGQLVEDLVQVRRRGYAIDDEESLPGQRCVGAPIWDPTGVVAAVSASGSTLLVTEERIGQIAEGVLEVANSVSVQLGGPPTPRR